MPKVDGANNSHVRRLTLFVVRDRAGQQHDGKHEQSKHVSTELYVNKIWRENGSFCLARALSS